MQLNQINIKIYTKETPPPEEFIPVFHSWIQESVVEELLIDVADYRHAPAGPGVLLIGHEANYSIEYGPEEQLGLLYNRKRESSESSAENLRQGISQALKAAQRLENDHRLKNKLSFFTGKIRLIMNCRKDAPNTEETFQQLKQKLKNLLNGLYPNSSYTLKRVSQDSRERLAVEVYSKTGNTVSELLNRMSLKNVAQPS